MNPAMNSIFSGCILIAVAWMFSLGLLTAQISINSPTVPRSKPEDRILVIVETSSAMQKRRENVQKIIGEMFLSGLGGDMRSGDSIGMWTFNNELQTGQFPLQRWTKATRERVAVTMVQFLQQQHFEKSARPSIFWDALTNIVAHSERITVIIVGSGSEPIKGTPFDESIAENYLKNDEAQRKAKMPFVTILRAYYGKLVSFSVCLPPWPMELPEYPKEARRAPEPAATKPAPVEPKSAVAPAIPAADHPPVYATNMPIIEPPSLEVSTNFALIAPDSIVTPTNEAATTKPAPPPEPSAKQNTVTSPASLANQKAPLPVVTILVAGIALLIGIMVVFIALLRWTRRSAGESLITRTMNKRDD